MSDIHRLAEMAIPGVITGKAIYEGRISLREIEKYNIA
jgi:phosphoribosylformimino-5-aminoimidazole carboxamide ribotide isomerase